MAFNKRRKFSYADQKNQRHFFRWTIIWIAAFFVIYNLLTGFLFSFRVLHNETMRPELHSGDHLIFSSYGLRRMMAAKPGNENLPFSRGSVVLIDKSLLEKRGFMNNAADALLRFFTAQKMSLFGQEDQAFVKRVIGLPGDEISISSFVARVKPSGEYYGLTEFELSENSYNIDIPNVPANWDESIPFSGNMETIVLGAGECFVLSDDRSNTNDSRTWGPVSLDFIAGKCVFRYWPLSRIGRP